MLRRESDEAALELALRRWPVVAILGPRQVGKTTLARTITERRGATHTTFDLEDPRDMRRLDDASTALRELSGLVVIDEVQRRPELFPLLRVLADRPRKPARFLVLGSASPHLLKQASESLAGRILFHELAGFGVEDVGKKHWRKLWLRGGFPRAFLARNEIESLEVRRALIRTYLERDLPELGFKLASSTIERFWTMLAHYHAQIWNASELARSFGLSHTTVLRWLEVLVDTFMVQLLRPWSTNVAKRQVKSPKVYFRDSGLLHALLDVRTRDDLEKHPRLGASFEGFALQEVMRRLRVDRRECYFWATHQGAELDLLVVRGSRRRGFEFKHTDAPAVTASMRIALQDLGLERLDVIHIGKETYPLTRQIRAVAFERLDTDLAPLR